MTKDQRKVQFTGNSTYIVSLPVKWISDIELEVGDTLTLIYLFIYFRPIEADLYRFSTKPFFSRGPTRLRWEI
ncbi:AbrB/MazE/SpoVT family DNA-binding domain-containing protein [Methanosarcina sp. UBA5]|uniref:AbrB/MazE/SpoVT family DNA-binding domain-containing protein n=1 Tax=Methanosarcina sp. UBA5 TaxID=1915593 RepID=UPI0032E39589